MADLYELGWRQGSVFEADLPAYWLVQSESGEAMPMSENFDRWVVCTQDCDLRSSPSNSTVDHIEIRPVFDEGPLDRVTHDWGIRSRKLRLNETWHANASSPRALVTAELLVSLGGTPAVLANDRARALKTWLGLRYDRPAIPERLVEFAKEVAARCGTRSGRAAGEEVHEVLMQFDEQAFPPKVALFAIVADNADRSMIRKWLAEAANRINPNLGVVAHIDARYKNETSLALIETSYAADLTQLTWRAETQTKTE